MDERDLPGTLSASLAARLARLSDDAREVCEALCLSDPDGSLPFDSCVALTSHRDSKRAFQAFDELVAARILIADAESYRFDQRGFLAVIEQGMSEERFRTLHCRLAEGLAARGGDLIKRVAHWLAAGRDATAIELLCSIDLTLQPPPLPLLERALRRAEERRLPTRTIHLLRRALLIKATPTMAFDSYLAHVPAVLAQVAKDSGYTHYMQLTDVPASDRLGIALARAHEQYLATPEHERVYDVEEGIREFALTTVTARAMGVLMLDRAFSAGLPSLEPFVALSPFLRLVDMAGDGTQEWLRGRFGSAQALFARVLSELDAPEHANIPLAEQTRIRFSMHYGLGVLDASRGLAGAERHAEMLERERAYRVNAWRVRRIWYLNLGDIEEADSCQRRAELLQLQDGHEQAYAGTHILSELMAFALAGDVLGIKSALDVIRSFAEKLPGWRPFLAYGQASCQLLQGDPAGALATLSPALEASPAGQHPAFGFLAGAHVSALLDLSRVAEAAEHGLTYVEASQRHGTSTTGQIVFVATADALARGGRFAEALA
ncbi:MAG TPA: hypothetical protein VGI70_05570, partial [Polyangiales bacterium]